MDGQQEYINKYNNQIEVTINKESGETKEVLRGYMYHLRDAFSISTKYSYLRTVKRFLTFVNKQVSEIKYEDYIAFLASIEDKSSTFKIATYAALKLFSEYLLASRRNTDNAMQYVKTPKTSRSKEKDKKEKRLNNVLHEDEIKLYIRNVENGICDNGLGHCRSDEWKERDRCIIEVFLTTGIRLSALYRLNVSDIDLATNSFTTLEKRDKKRTFFFAEKTRICIEEWLLKRKELLNGVEEDALFISNRKKRLDQTCISRVTKKYGKGIKNTSPHKLRATFGTQLLDKTNGDLDKVRIAMGHNSVSTTELYMRRDETAVGKEIAELMSDII